MESILVVRHVRSTFLDNVDDSVDVLGSDQAAVQLLSELVRTVEDVAYLSWSPTVDVKIVIESLASEDELSHYEGQLRLADQGRLDDWLESPDGTGEADEYEYEMMFLVWFGGFFFRFYSTFSIFNFY